MPWSPNRSSGDSAGTESIFAIVQNHPGVRFKFEVESTGESPAFVPEDALLRLLCHIFIERLPADAISSVWECIHDAWGWHSRPIRLMPPPEIPTSTPSANRVFAVVDEPPFRILEE